ncbi:unnamed protein product [Linum tenue]|uniref:C2 NT-type domain-containing protein n=1 Tax=Linum tenue TaxID=586396 RepID=A0AAV0JYV7_9ROSI|nr:unnamed protein product [Linum tenue]
MFRPVRWRSDKNKIKVVFKFQFHATQVSQLNVDSLVVSVVPGDVGKPTGRSEKAPIKDGSCRWEYPVYETVKFSHDSKTGKINERMYHFIVSTGSAKSSVVGEASVDLAAYAEVVKASNVSLPLKNSKANGVLHVSIQKLQANIDQREEEETEAAIIKPRNKTLNTLFNNGESDEIIKNFPNADASNATNSNAEYNKIATATSGSSDLTLSSPEASSELNTPREDPASLLASKTQTSAPQQTEYEWSVDSDHALSIESSTNSSHGGDKSQLVSDGEVEKLKAELLSMTRQLDLSELELQTLRKQVVKESKRGHDLLRDLAGVQAECKKLKAFQKGREEATKTRNKSISEGGGGGGDPWLLIEEIRQELYYEKDRNTNLQLQLQKTQESNAELLLAVRELEEMLEQKGTTQSTDDEQKALEELVKEHGGTRDTYVLEQRIVDLSSEIEIYKRDKDELEMQMEQIALDYEILKQENHELSYRVEQSQLQEQLKMQYECSPQTDNTLESQIERLEDELKEQGIEYSISLATIKELQNHIKSVEAELSLQQKANSGYLANIDELQNHIKSTEEQMKLQEQSAAASTRELEDQVERLENEHSSSLTTINELQNQIKSLEEEMKLQEQSTADSTRELEDHFQRLENEHSSSLATISELQNQIKSLEEEVKLQEQSTVANTRELEDHFERLENEHSSSLATINELQNHIKGLEEEMKLQEENIAASRKELKAQIESLENERSSSLATIDELKIHIKSLEEELKQQEELMQQHESSKQLEAQIKRLQNELKKQQKLNSGSLVTIKELEAHISRMEEELERRVQGFEADIAKVTRERVDQEQRAIQAEEALRLTRWKNSNTAEKLQEEFRRLSVQMASTFEANEKVAMKAMAEANDVRFHKSQLEDMLHKANSELQSVKDDYEEKLKELSKQLSLKSGQIEKLLMEIDEKSKHEEQLGGSFIQKVQKLQAEIEKLVKENNLLSVQVEEMKTSIKTHEGLVQKGNIERNELLNTIASLKKEADKSKEDLTTLRSLEDEKEKELGLLKAEVDTLKCNCDELKHSLIEDEPEKEKLRKQLCQLKGDLKKKDEVLINTEKKLKESNKRTSVVPRTNKSTPVSHGTKEVSNLREKIKLLELHIKSKETELETSASSFLQKERDLMDKIEELEKRQDELNQCSASLTCNPPHKLNGDATDEDLENVASVPKDKRTNDEAECENESKPFTMDDKLVRELLSMKEKNEEMECELKEMQERYSEISLKFAEVEGERQKLVMTVRSLKNARKELIKQS